MTARFARPQGVLLDIEGTTSSIKFVYDVMFPFVREHLNDYLQHHWADESVQACLPLLAEDVEQPSDWLQGQSQADQVQTVCQAVIEMMDNDRKATGLKQLQGLIWKSGFESGEMVAHVYDDVIPAIEQWKQLGIDIRIYSSGSIGAQKLFFGHTTGGSLLDRFSNHYDTTTGSKRDSASYTKIAGEYDCESDQVLFVSDVVAELDAAKTAGLATALSIREGNPPVEDGHGHPTIHSFSEIAFD